MPTSIVGRLNEPAGFTLVELGVVIIILTLALGLVLPEASSLFTGNDLKKSSRRLVGAVEHARSQAMVQGRLWELTLDLDSGSFWATAVEDSEESEADSSTKRALAGEVRFLDVQKLDQEMKISGSVPIRFQSKGLAEPAVIHLAGSGDKVQTLLIKSFNGRVDVLDGYVGKDGEQGG